MNTKVINVLGYELNGNVFDSLDEVVEYNGAENLLISINHLFLNKCYRVAYFFLYGIVKSGREINDADLESAQKKVDDFKLGSKNVRAKRSKLNKAKKIADDLTDDEKQALIDEMKKEMGLD